MTFRFRCSPRVQVVSSHHLSSVHLRKFEPPPPPELVRIVLLLPRYMGNSGGHVGARVSAVVPMCVQLCGVLLKTVLA